MNSKLYKFYTEDLLLRVSVAITTDLVKEMKTLHGSLPLGTLATGRLMTGAFLLASQLSEGHALSFRFNGKGTLGDVFAEASFEGKGRAYCHNPEALPDTYDEHPTLGKAIGPGTLVVAHTSPFQKQPQMSIVPILSGEIAEDLAYYLQQSSQIPSVIALSVKLDKKGDVTAALGIILQLMPGATPKVIQEIENKTKNAQPLYELVKTCSPLELVKAFAHTDQIVPVEEIQTLTYHCQCSTERVDRTLILLGKAALAEMVLKGEAVPVKCEFCGKSYDVKAAHIKTLHGRATE